MRTLGLNFALSHNGASIEMGMRDWGLVHEPCFLGVL